MSDGDIGNSTNQHSTYSFLKKVLIFVLITLSVILMVLFIGRAVNTLLVIFAGILLGILFRAARDLVHKLTRLPHGLSLGVVILLFFSFMIGLAYLLGPSVYRQGEMFRKEIPKEYTKLQKQISGYGWGRELIRENPHFKDIFETENKNTTEANDMTKSVIRLFSGIATLGAALLLIFVTAIYIAAEPKLYSEGFVRLFPKHRRDKVLQIMDEISLAIQWWLVGQVCSMLLLGVITTLGLWLLGVPFPLLLGIFTAIMTFIPNLGPLIAAIPTLLISLTISIQTAIYVLIFYSILQCIEGYFITPMIHRNAISVPPVLIITFQFLLYYLIGILGVFLAMPLIACGMVIVKRLYIEEILGDPLEEHLSHDLEGHNII